MTNTAPLRAADLLNTIGINTHVPYTDGGYANIGNVASDLAYLGVNQVRDGISDGLWGSASLSSFIALAQKGITFTIGVVDSTVHDKATLDARLLLVQRLVQAVPGSVIAIEGANEINNWPVTYNGVGGLQGAVDLQKDLYAAVHANPVFAGVAVDYFTGYGGSLGEGPNPATTPGLADDDTQHPYPLSGSAPAAWVAPARAASNETGTVGPLVYTETGYSSNGGTWAGVDLSVQARYTLDLLFDDAAKGVAKTDLYELMDAYATGSPQGNEGFGLFNTDNSPKPVATAIHNLTTILADPGTPGAAAAAAVVAPTVTGLPATGQTMVLQKANGASDIVVWAEPQIWNPATGTEIAASTSPVTVNLGGLYASVAVFDPLRGSTPLATLANAGSVQIGLSDHPLIVEVSGAIPPPTVAITAQALTKDTGASPTDNVTSNGAVTLSGTSTGAAGTAVRVDDGSTSLGTATLGAGGSWSFATTLAAGTHMLTATAVDPAGRSATAAAGSAITVVTAKPTLTVSSEVLAPDQATETLTGTVGGPVGTTVAVFNGTSLLGAAALDGKGGWSFSTALRPGSYDLTAVATDLAGNTASVDPPVTVPAIPVATPASVSAVAAPSTAPADTLVLDLSEDAYLGDAQFTVSIDGTQVGGPTSVTALHSLGQHQTFSVSGNYGAGPHLVGVNFLNDAWAGTPSTDRNLYVNGITFDGAATAENAAQLSQGLATYTILPVVAAGAATTAATPAAADTLTLNVAEDAYLGDATFTVTVDGKQVGGPMSATALRRLGQGQDVVLTGTFGSGPHVIGVNFLNDAWGGTATTDRNLYVNSITLDGNRTTVNGAQFSQGLASYAIKPPAATGNGLTLLLSDDAYKGDAQFTVSVDGKQVGGVETVSASHAAGQTQAFTLVGQFGTGSHAVAVNFINDYWEGTPQTDRNLYVKSLALDGGTTVANVAQLSGGARSYQVQSGSTGALAAFQVAPNATLILASDAPAGASVSFAGNPGTLELTDAGSFHGAIAGFGQGDVLDLRSIAAGSATALSLNAAGNVLTVTNGSNAATLSLTGSYTSANFAMASDTHGGTAVSFVPSPLARTA